VYVFFAFARRPTTRLTVFLGIATVNAYVGDIKAMFANQVSGDIINAWNVGNSFRALHVKTSPEYDRSRPTLQWYT
jgi:hypothetical protein